ncbi:hypothetical protein [Saccharothrix variisporea]|uniref:Uncharacterized protein n=1 Tax=Saccharothrix variisporea TaxID=543527 RepID=A0A495XHD4_9PSEU|nr:hypothetical protein [Saccharothrix variisporea]RKT72174.1 hypothetical protein DFJ66_5482 [Saccharothrix variisporea]
MVADTAAVVALSKEGATTVAMVLSATALIVSTCLVVFYLRRHQSKVAALCAVVALLGSGVLGFTVRGRPTDFAEECKASGVIFEPRRDQQVRSEDARTLAVKGDVKGRVCNGETLWPYVRLVSQSGNSTYFQQDGPCTIDVQAGSFQCPYLGITSGPGTRADLQVYLADSTLTRVLTNNRVRHAQRSTPAPNGERDVVTSSQPPAAKLMAETSILIKS